MLSSADHSVSPPIIEIPRVYNAACDLIDRNLHAGRAAKIAYIDDAGEYSYAELASRVDRFGNAVRGLGIQMEQRVLLCLHDTIDFPVAFLGCIKTGIVPIAVNTLLSASDFEYVLADSRCCAVVISAALLATLEPLLLRSAFVRHVIVSGTSETRHESMSALLGAPVQPCEPAPTTCDDMCF